MFAASMSNFFGTSAPVWMSKFNPLSTKIK